MTCGKADLFGPKLALPRRIMMHAVDAGQAGYMMPTWTTEWGADFTCPHCGYEAGWIFNLSDSEVRRGVPCPKCNEASNG